MNEMETRLDRPYTRREVLREATGLGMMVAGSATGVYAASELDQGDVVDSKDRGVNLKGIVAAGVGLALILRGGMQAVEVGHEMHDVSYDEFEAYLKQQGIREVHVEPVHEQVYRYEPLMSGGAFAVGTGVHIPQGEGYFTMYSAKTSNGKDVAFRERNAFLKDGKDSKMHQDYVMRNVLTANLRAYQLMEHIPGIRSSIDLEAQVDGRTYGELLAEARGRGFYAYHRPQK